MPINQWIGKVNMVYGKCVCILCIFHIYKMEYSAMRKKDIMQSDINETETSTVWYHLYVE